MPSTKRLCERAGLSTCIVVLLMIIPGAPAAAAEGDVLGCKPVIGRVVSRQGTVEIRRTGDSVWHRVERLDTQVCDGDAVRTGPRSRAALWLQPENLIRLDQRTAVTIAANQSETKVEFFTSGQVSADPDCGAAYFISRFPRNFGVKTPFLSAAIKGTEFLVSAQCSATTLAVFEGIVEAQELLSGRTFLVESLQQISVGPQLPSTIPIPIKPRDGVQWTIFYPRISVTRRASQELTLERCDAVEDATECELGNVEVLLRAGAYQSAMATLDRLRQSGQSGAGILALSATVRIALDDRDEALGLAARAIAADPLDPRAWTALSYASQAQLDLDGALHAAVRAEELASDSPLMRARTAELLLALGRIDAAERKALDAVAKDVKEPRARLMLGFVRLAKSQPANALAEFRDAIDLDSAEPLARIGAGLAQIKMGRIAEGRENLEIAVALDPTKAATRSYLGRAYFEERKDERNPVSMSQFELGKRLDPNDPTPWFFDGVRKQAVNDPIGAAKALNESIRLNDFRAPVRGRDQLDDDYATRTAAIARTYRDLGFSELSLQEAIRAFSYDQQSYAAHRLLSEAYAGIPRQEVARVSEVLQAQLREPTIAPPLSASLAESGLQLPAGASPFGTGLADYSSAFDRDRIAFQAAGWGGNLASRGGQALLGWASGPVSGSVTAYRYSTDGVRPFNQIDREILDASFRIVPTYGLTLQAGFNGLDSTFGDVPIRFDPDNYARAVNTDKSGAAFIAARYAPTNRAETLVYLSNRNQQGGATFDNGDVLAVTNSSSRVDIQETVRLGRAQVVGGVSYAEGRSFEDVFGFFTIDFKPFHSSAYSYLYLPVERLNLRVEAGGTYDKLRARESGDQERFNPKIGLVWTPDDATLVRIGYLESIKRRFVAEQVLEPVSTAGFSQIADDATGSRVRRRGIAAARWLGSSINVGFEASERDIAVPVTDFTGEVSFDPQKERSAVAYLYWLSSRHLAVSVEYRADQFRRSQLAPGALGFSWLDQQQVPISLRFFAGERVSASVTARYLHQKGEFQVANTPSDFFLGEERNWLFDAAVRFVLPNRRGFISIEGRNLLDEHFSYQETDQYKIRIPVSRSVLVRFLVEF